MKKYTYKIQISVDTYYSDFPEIMDRLNELLSENFLKHQIENIGRG